MCCPTRAYPPEASPRPIIGAVQDHEGAVGSARGEGTELALAQLVANSELRLACIAVESGLGRPVRWVHTTELLDPSPYLRGRELVCTVGSSLVDGPSCRRFVLALSRAQASGLCFGVGDVHDDVPHELIDACRDASLPLLVAPHGAPFMNITEFVAQHRSDVSAARHDENSELVARLLAQVRTRAPITAMLDLAADALGGRLVLSDDGRADEMGGLPLKLPTDVVVSARSVDGATLTWSGQGPPPSSSLIGALAQVVGVARHEQDVGDELHRERFGQLLTLVGERLASPTVLAEVIAAASLPADGLIYSVWPAGASRVLVPSFCEGPFVVAETPQVTIAITTSSEMVRTTAQRLEVACGFSTVVPIEDSARGIGEARATYSVARTGGGCVGPEGLVTLEGLLLQQPPERLRPFVDRLLGPLELSDSTKHTSYLPTLMSYLRHDGSLTATARADFLHVNTVRYRLDRIRELTGVDPLRFEDRVALAIAIWAKQGRDRFGSN